MPKKIQERKNFPSSRNLSVSEDRLFHVRYLQKERAIIVHGETFLRRENKLAYVYCIPRVIYSVLGVRTSVALLPCREEKNGTVGETAIHLARTKHRRYPVTCHLWEGEGERIIHMSVTRSAPKRFLSISSFSTVRDAHRPTALPGEERHESRCRYKITRDKITHSKSPTQNHPGQNHPL